MPQPGCAATSETCCPPQPLCCAAEPQTCVTVQPCTPNATCAVPERCPPTASQGCCESNGCYAGGKRQKMMTCLCDRLFGKHQTGCSPQPPCVDKCTTGCGDRCDNKCSPLIPQRRIAPCRPSHGASPLAPCLEDPFVGHEKPTQTEQAADAPADVTAPSVPTAPDFEDALPLPTPERTLDPMPQSSIPQYVRPRTYIEPQIWPRLKVAPVVNYVQQPGTHPTSWSR